MLWSSTRLFGAAVLVALAAVGCAPEPKSVPCSNDGACRSVDERLQYCLRSKCVECVGVSGCKTGQVCDNGACVQCINDQGCPSGNRCVDGSCQSG